MTQDNLKKTDTAIKFTDIKGAEHVISDSELNNTDIRIDLSVRVSKVAKIIDKNGNEAILELGDYSENIIADDNERLKIDRSLEYHVDMVNCYFDEIESSITITRKEYDRLLTLLEERTKNDKEENNSSTEEVADNEELSKNDSEENNSSTEEVINDEEPVKKTVKASKKTTKKTVTKRKNKN